MNKGVSNWCDCNQSGKFCKRCWCRDSSADKIVAAVSISNPVGLARRSSEHAKLAKVAIQEQRRFKLAATAFLLLLLASCSTIWQLGTNKRWLHPPKMDLPRDYHETWCSYALAGATILAMRQTACCGGVHQRGAVVAASYEARKFGSFSNALKNRLPKCPTNLLSTPGWV